MVKISGKRQSNIDITDSLPGSSPNLTPRNGKKARVKKKKIDKLLKPQTREQTEPRMKEKEKGLNMLFEPQLIIIIKKQTNKTRLEIKD